MAAYAARIGTRMRKEESRMADRGEGQQGGGTTEDVHRVPAGMKASL
jgi:hypothetical protein